MNLQKDKKRISDIITNAFGEEFYTMGINTTTDNQLCENIIKNLTFLDTIKDSKIYISQGKDAITFKINLIIRHFSNYLSAITKLNIFLDTNYFNNTEEDHKYQRIKQKIELIKNNSKHFPSSSKFDDDKIIKLINFSNKKKYTIKEISKILNYPYSTLLLYVKNILCFRYVKCNRLNYRSLSIDNKYQHIYFCDNFSNIIKNDSYYIFLDECSFNSNKRSSKLWIELKKKNIMYDKLRISGLNFVLAASKDEIFYFEVIKNKLNSEKFCSFLENLINKIRQNVKLNEIYMQKKLYLIYDNCTIHKSKETVAFLKTKLLNILTLPSYSPYYNLCEFVFSNLKRKFYKRIFSSK